MIALGSLSLAALIGGQGLPISFRWFVRRRNLTFSQESWDDSVRFFRPLTIAGAVGISAVVVIGIVHALT